MLTKLSKSVQSRLMTLGKAFALISLLLFRTHYPDFLENHLGVSSRYLHAVIFFFTGWLIIDLLKLFVIRIYRRRNKLKGSMTDNFVLGMEQISGLVTVAVVVFAGLIALNIDIREAFTALSIVAAAIAILSKDYVSNAINGVIIMFGDQFSLGDIIQVGDHRGRIVDLTLLNIHLLNDDDDLIYIPNSVILTMSTVNYTKRPVKKISIEFEISLQAMTDVQDLERYLIRSLADYAEQVLPDTYNLKVVELKKDHAILKFQYILRGNDRDLERNIRKRTVRKVVDYVEARIHGNNTPQAV
jgi:small-conductance mechanosensitive channel